MKTSVENKRIKIDLLSLERITNWVKIAKGEVSGLGLVEDRGEDFFISHVFLLKQRCTDYGTELEESSIAELMVKLEGMGVDSGRLRFWWHSHGSMQTFWSNTDDNTIEGLANGAYFISSVFNKRGDVKSRIDLFEPIRAIFDEAVFEPELPCFDSDLDCLREFREKVAEGISLGTSLSKPKEEKKSVSPYSPDDCYDAYDGYLPYEIALDELEKLDEKLNRGEMTLAEYCQATGISAEELIGGGRIER